MVSLKLASTDKEREDAFAVRRTVFVEEQGVPLHIELDEGDETAVHFIAYDGDRPIAAGRIREIGEGTGKVERVCVLPEYRGQRLGQRMMVMLEDHAREAGLSTIRLNAQSHAQDFYTKIGYSVTSPEFLDAGIPHRAMEKSLVPMENSTHAATDE
ncbi:GNAT family N-acetyltransferase [Edaphobacillus lindanitolerans]|uniref:Predicted N-acyltransferase, GNAT family n=1 Tax=Edaphobacillus lindanitolerans TaxID=550447 RepID=A0A1U7PLH6_9BACI|nr:GNAT family N-acetyltransferase [Edaphobacillus lindanitolerans]SIT68635.1 Predicted N-acyltransferase, GNAT family [Edaphobacillus lindanitolerans]